jgi:hypothetical protein
MPRDDYAKLSSKIQTEEEIMVHRTFKTLEPAGEISVVQRPEGKVKVVVYTGTGKDSKEIFGVTMDRKAAFDLAMEMLQHLYRLGAAE